MNITNWLRTQCITAPAVLLFMALAAQAPHAMAVFVRVAPHTAPWEVWVSVFGGLVYAVALEGATAFFVWRSELRWAIAFAVFSVLHNVAYYMPAAWTVDAWGATLLWRDVVGSALISVSLPHAIAAFSHVQARQRKAATPALPVPAPAVAPATPTDAPTQTDDAPQLPAIAERSSGEIAAALGVTRQAVDGWRKRGTLQRNIARLLPDVAPAHVNGNGKA